MIVAVDVHYREDFAKVVGLTFEHWTDPLPLEVRTIQVREVAPYVPGAFYQRELPCILRLLSDFAPARFDLILIDGYVVLDEQGKAGLGKYLFEALGAQVSVVGVAKKRFKDNGRHVVEVLRGESRNPLYVTSIGFPLQEAAKRVGQMHGNYRLPDLLRLLDQETKSD